MSDSVWGPQWVQTQDWILRVSPAFIYIFNHIHSAVQFFWLHSLLFEVSDFYLNFFFLSLKEFLPKEYIKHKGDKKIFQVRSGLLHHTAQRCLVATLGWNFSWESEMQQIQHATLNESITLIDFVLCFCRHTKTVRTWQRLRPKSAMWSLPGLWKPTECHSFWSRWEERDHLTFPFDGMQNRLNKMEKLHFFQVHSGHNYWSHLEVLNSVSKKVLVVIC